MKIIIKILSAAALFVLGAAPVNAETAAVYEPQYKYVKLDTAIKAAYVTIGETTNPPVVLIHGFTDSYLSFAQVAPLIADAGYFVIIPDLRGHGASDKPKKGYYSVAEHTADINNLLDKLKIKKALIAGHSLGSFIGQNLAVKNPDKVSAITLIGSAATVEGNETLAWLLNGDGETFEGINNAKELPEAFLKDWTLSTNYDPAFVSKTLENAKKLPLYAWVNAANGISGNPENLSKIKVPAQIIWGTKDAFFSLKDQLELIEKLGSDKILFIKKEGASHNTHWDEQLYKDISKDIVSFIKSNSYAK
ncbi:MAG: alpha/beta hydrolase [Endomicrobium sp.]|jgi:pimeloyl-ACP methyl ester carboxylesterase|nr:alpha/beta hydrolase [Endomicrobium sp.]